MAETLRADAVFEGGGVKGIALVGALAAFEESHYAWQNLAGTSAGAITAALVTVGYSATNIKRIMETRVTFAKFMDASGLGVLPVVGPWLNLLLTRGLYRGDYFLGLMRDLIAESPRAKALGKKQLTFGDLITQKQSTDSEEDYQRKYKYRLRVIASGLTNNEMLVLPQDIAGLGGHPDELEVALAVRMSMSIPFFFRPVLFPEGLSRREKHWIVDGGMLSNFPVWLFDSPGEPAWPTFGFLLWEPDSDKPRHAHIRRLVSTTRAMVPTMTHAHDRKILSTTDMSRVVRMPTGPVSGTDFKLSLQARDRLYASGYKAAQAFLAGWDFDAHLRQRRAAASHGTTGPQAPPST